MPRTGTLTRTLTGHTGLVRSVAFSPDGNTIVSGSGSLIIDDTTVRLWDARKGELIRTLTGHTHWVNSVSFSPDGNTLASGSDDGTILLWALTQETREPPSPPNDSLEGYMTTEESMRWLEAQGYTVERNDNGYTIKRERIVTDSGGAIIRDHVFVEEISQGALIGIGEGIFITTDSSGDIRVKVSGSQSGSDN